MQPFPDFNLFSVIETDLAQLRERRTHQRMMRQADKVRSGAEGSFFSRLLRKIATPQPATPSGFCGD